MYDFVFFLCFLSAVRAKPLHDEIGVLHFKAFRKSHFGDGNVGEADRLTTTLAMEMHMQVVVFLMVETVAKLVTGTFCGIECMDEMLFLEQGQCSKNARLVDAPNTVFQLAHGKGMRSLCQGLNHDDTVGRWTDAVLLH